VFDLTAYLLGLGALLAAAAATWALSVAKRDVSIVDSLWGPMFALAALAYAWPFAELAPRGALVLALVGAWALRLTLYITARNAGAGEDYRYREIRRRNEPHFALKSLYLVFGLQAVLAWLVSLPLLAAQRGAPDLGLLDAVGVALALGGLVLESVADWQLARFKRDDGNRGRVLDRGLWRYSRHPNYFGECCVWWGFGCLGLAAGGWWSLVSPLIMTVLLLRVSGVALLEQTIGERRPGYADYVQRTSAFVPWPARKPLPPQMPIDPGV
jgi:steroid 5-alpha reductase family enzyme